MFYQYFCLWKKLFDFQVTLTEKKIVQKMTTEDQNKLFI